MEVVKLWETWATTREQEAHKEALQWFGEKVLVRRVWKLDDLLAGRVERCSQCQAGGAAKARVAAVYKNAGDTYCASCYGTGFEGGFEPTVYVLYAIFGDTGRDWLKQTGDRQSGDMAVDRPTVQFPWNPVLDPGDVVVRVLNWDDEQTPQTELDRYVLDSVEWVTIRTGAQRARFGSMTTGDDALLVAQKASVKNIAQEHPYRSLPFVDGGFEALGGEGGDFIIT